MGELLPIRLVILSCKLRTTELRLVFLGHLMSLMVIPPLIVIGDDSESKCYKSHFVEYVIRSCFHFLSFDTISEKTGQD